MIQVNEIDRRGRHLSAMARSFSMLPLSAGEIGPAFPLVNAAYPTVDLARWRRFVEPLVEASASSSAGASGMRNEAGYFCGLMAYRVDRDLQYGLLLVVTLFVALDLVDETAAVRALLDAIEAKARELDCVAVHIRLGGEQSSLAKNVKAAGFRAEAQLFSKPVEATSLPT